MGVSFTSDQLTKLWVATVLETLPQVLVPGLLELRLTVNRGMALGLMTGNTIATLLLPVVAILVWTAVFRRYHATTYKHVACALMLGGFLGNFLDRILRGYVVDMLYFPFLPWFICNVADIVICTGVVLLAISLLFRPADWREKHAKAD